MCDLSFARDFESIAIKKLKLINSAREYKKYLRYSLIYKTDKPMGNK